MRRSDNDFYHQVSRYFISSENERNINSKNSLFVNVQEFWKNFLTVARLRSLQIMLLPRGSADAGRLVLRIRILPRALRRRIAESRFAENHRLLVSVLLLIAFEEPTHLSHRHGSRSSIKIVKGSGALFAPRTRLRGRSSEILRASGQAAA